MPDEAVKTKRARQKIIQLYTDQGYQVTEEEVFPCFNNMGEAIFPPYQADILVTKKIIIELDPTRLHGTARHRSKDHWRDENIFREYSIPTARLNPDDIIKQVSIDILLEIDSQVLEQNNNKK